MDALDILVYEHRQIQRVLDVLEQAIAQGRARAPVPASLFQRAAHFFLTHVDGNHQTKEGVLFHAMVEQRLPLGPGVLSHVAGQHGLGREQAEELLAAATAVLSAHADPEPMYAAAERYVRLHRSHTVAEEIQVFPLARRLLPLEVLERVRARFARIEGSHGSLEEAADAVELAFPLARGALRTAWSVGRTR